jgi:uncharacterized damage-inducible protein DinB
MTQGERLALFARRVRESSLKRFRRVDPADRDDRPDPGTLSLADHLAHLVECDRWLLELLRGGSLPPPTARAGGAAGRSWDLDLADLAALGEEKAAFFAGLCDKDLDRGVDAPPALECPDAGMLILRANLDHEIHHRGMVQLLFRLREARS